MDFTFTLLRAALGLAIILGACWALSDNRRRVNWRLVASGVALQIVLGLLILRVPEIRTGIEGVAAFFYRLVKFSDEGAAMLFGKLPSDPGSWGIAFTVLPTIIFFSAFSAVLYHLRILQWIVYGFAWLLSKTMRLSGAECLAAAANIFIGQTEAPLVIKPYLKSMTRSEIMSLMTGGMATIAGGVLVIYISILGGGDPDTAIYFGKHLLTASILSAPAAMVAAKLIAPQTEAIDPSLAFPKERASESLLDAATRGASDGIRLALNVGGLLIAFVALLALLNYLVAEGIGSWTGLNDWASELTDGRAKAFDFSFVLGLLSAPFAWVLGVPNADLLAMGQLLGERVALNEFVAYLKLGEWQQAGVFTSEKSILIATYALCGFANFASVGIQIGGISALEESQRPNLLKCGIKSMLGGLAACYMTAIVASVIVG